MKAFSLFASAIVLIVVHNCSAAVPSDIQKCHAGDVQCIASSTNEILRRYPNGNKELGLRNLEPVHLDELVVAKAQTNSPLSLNMKFTDLNMYGLSKINVTKIVGFENDPRRSKFQLYLTIPLLTLRGQYEANGRLLLLPIVGKGNAEVQLKNFKSAVKPKFTVTNEDGKSRLTITKVKVRNDPESMVVRLDNLFGGNKALGGEINRVINTNWKDVWSEMESGINEGYAKVVHFLVDDVFKTITYDEFFSD